MKPDRPMPGLLTLAAAAEYLSLPLETIRYFVFRTRAIDSYKVGRRRMLKRADLDALIERGKVPAFAPKLRAVR